MIKRIFFFSFFIFHFSLLLGQSDRFEITPRQGASRTLVTGASVYIVHHVTSDSLALTEFTGNRAGTYYRNSVTYGRYKIYVNGTLVKSNHPFGIDRAYEFVEAMDSDGDNVLEASNTINASAVVDSTISLAKFTTAAYQYIGSGGSITNNADDTTIKVNGSSQLYVDPDNRADVITDSLLRVDSREYNMPYIGFFDDASDQSSTMQTLLEQLKDSTSYTLLVPNKEYVFNDLCDLDSCENIKIKGTATGSIWKFGSDPAAGFRVINSKNIIIEDMVFDGQNHDNNDPLVIARSEKVWINRCNFINWDRHLLRIVGSDSVWVTNCFLMDTDSAGASGDHGLDLDYASASPQRGNSHIFIDHNFIYNDGYDAIKFENTTHAKVTNNYLYGRIEIIDDAGCFVSNDQIDINNNYFGRTTNSQTPPGLDLNYLDKGNIRITNNYFDSCNVTITNNTDNAGGDVAVTQFSDNILSHGYQKFAGWGSCITDGNTFNYADSHAVFTHHTGGAVSWTGFWKIQNNLIFHPDYDGIRLWYANVTALGFDVLNNTIISAGHSGISILGAYLVDNIKVFGNTVEKAQGFGAFLKFMHNALVFNNTFKDNWQGGPATLGYDDVDDFLLGDLFFEQTNKLTASNNHIFSVKNDSISGIYLKNSDFSQLNSNKIYNAANGIYARSGNDNLLIQMNTVDSCSINGIFAFETGSGSNKNMSIKSNIVSNSGQSGIRSDIDIPLIMGNFCYDNGVTSTAAGIRVNADSSSVIGNMLKNLNATQEYGIWITSGADATWAIVNDMRDGGSTDVFFNEGTNTDSTSVNKY